MGMKEDEDRQTKRSVILDRLRSHFGEDRVGELGDMDGLGMLSTFLRRIPPHDGGDGLSEELGDDLSREDVRLIRRRRRDQGAEETDGEPVAGSVADTVDGLEQAAAEKAMTFSALIGEIPRMRENLAEWISSADADYLPSSSTREELEALRDKAEYRLKILKVMANETQKELEALTLAIRAGEAMGST